MSPHRFGTIDGAGLVIATVVGAGIFTVPGYVASTAGSGAAAIALWVAGGLMALAGALSYAELAARFPRGGAEYTYIREAFGPTAGFLSGWTSFIAGFSGAIAAAAVGFANYLAAFVPAAGGMTSGIAIALITIFTCISVSGIRASRMATNALSMLIVAGITLVVVVCFAGTPAPVTASTSFTPAALSALVPIFFTYSGWNAAAYVAGEFRDPSRTVPRALLIGTLGVTALYIGLNVALLRTLSLDGLAQSKAPVAAAASAVLGAWGGGIVGALVLAALASSVCAMVITGPRVYLEMARDGVLLPLFARRTAGDRVPVVAAIAQSVWSSVLVLTGTFEQIVTYTGFAIVMFSGLAVAALFVLRRQLGVPTTFSVPGYPLLPAAFLVCALLIAVASFRYAPDASLVGLALIAAGIPVRWVMRSASAGSSSSTEVRTINS